MSSKLEDENELSPEQIENWRRILIGMIGPYAMLMSVEEIQKYKDSLQKQLDEETKGGKQ